MTHRELFELALNDHWFDYTAKHIEKYNITFDWYEDYINRFIPLCCAVLSKKHPDVSFGLSVDTLANLYWDKYVLTLKPEMAIIDIIQMFELYHNKTLRKMGKFDELQE